MMTLHSKNYFCKMDEVNLDALVQETVLAESSGAVLLVMMKM
jgi:hypothetical protein